MKISDYLGPAFLVIVCVTVAAIYGFVATERPLTGPESILLQSFAIGAGLLGSFLFGKQSAKEAAKEMLKPHARSAFRRLLSLFQSLSRVAKTIEKTKHPENLEEPSVTLAKLEVIVIEQLSTADDALEDWRDIVPDEVDELRQKLIEQKSSEDN